MGNRIIRKYYLLFLLSLNNSYCLENGNTIHIIKRSQESQRNSRSDTSSPHYIYHQRDNRIPISAASLFENGLGNLLTDIVLQAAGARRPAATSLDSTVPPFGTYYEQIRQNLLTINTMISSIREPSIQNYFTQVKSPIDIFNTTNHEYQNIGYPVFYKGQWIDCLDTSSLWLEATILEVNYDSIYVHYNGWQTRWDEWIEKNSPRIAPFRTKTMHSFLSCHYSPTPVSFITNIEPTGNDSLELLIQTLPNTINQILPAINQISEICHNNNNNNNNKELKELCKILSPLLDRVGRIFLDIAPQLNTISDSNNNNDSVRRQLLRPPYVSVALSPAYINNNNNNFLNSNLSNPPLFPTRLLSFLRPTSLMRHNNIHNNNNNETDEVDDDESDNNDNSTTTNDYDIIFPPLSSQPNTITTTTNTTTNNNHNHIQPSSLIPNYDNIFPPLSPPEPPTESSLPPPPPPPPTTTTTQTTPFVSPLLLQQPASPLTSSTSTRSTSPVVQFILAEESGISPISQMNMILERANRVIEESHQLINRSNNSLFQTNQELERSHQIINRQQHIYQQHLEQQQQHQQQNVLTNDAFHFRSPFQPSQTPPSITATILHHQIPLEEPNTHDIYNNMFKIINNPYLYRASILAQQGYADIGINRLLTSFTPMNTFTVHTNTNTNVQRERSQSGPNDNNNNNNNHSSAIEYIYLYNL